jgi:acylphosphatase
MAKELRTTHYSGDVQGVGFRYTACHVAQRYDVAGYVRNLPDGRVECVVEGEAGEIGAFLGELAQRMRGYIRDQTQQVSTFTGTYAGFGVRY